MRGNDKPGFVIHSYEEDRNGYGFGPIVLFRTLNGTSDNNRITLRQMGVGIGAVCTQHNETIAYDLSVSRRERIINNVHIGRLREEGYKVDCFV